MKAIIITRAIEESKDSEELRTLLDNTDILKIAINNANCKADIRLFLDYWYWEEHEKLSGKMMTRVNDCISKENHEKFIFFNVTKTPCTKDNTELFVCNSSLDTAIDLAYKIGITELLLIADNNIVEDGIKFFKGFIEGIKRIVDFYNTKMNIYQFTQGNLNLKIKTVKEFINA
jgi:hypothetical protein